jgi:hypothetical protein
MWNAHIGVVAADEEEQPAFEVAVHHSGSVGGVSGSWAAGSGGASSSGLLRPHALGAAARPGPSGGAAHEHDDEDSVF